MGDRPFAAQARGLCPESVEHHDGVWFCQTCRMIEWRLTPVTELLRTMLDDDVLSVNVHALQSNSLELYPPGRLHNTAQSGKVVHVSGAPRRHPQQEGNHLIGWLGLAVAVAALIVNIAMLIVMIRQGRSESRKPGGRHRRR